MRDRSWQRVLLIGGGLVLVGLLTFGAWQAVRTYSAWNSVERVGFDTANARNLLPGVPLQTQEENTTPTYAVTEYTAVLAIGSDERPEDEPVRQERVFADAVLLYLSPDDDGNPLLVSLPRDLLVVNPCSGEETKLDRTLEGCGDDVSGPELVALAVEDFTGIHVDHFALFGFEGFVEVIDALGGVELCVPNSLRQGNTDLLPAGCSTADGDTALRYVRSRTTQEQIDGEWQFVEDESDLKRAERQQQLMFALLARLKAIGSPLTLASVAEGLGDTVVLSESLALGQAVDMAWELRRVPASSIRRVIVPTEPVTTTDGAFALRSTASFQDLLET